MKTVPINSYSYFPIYLLEFLKVFSVGMMTTASSNHMLLELDLGPGISSFITGLYSAGFMVAALFFGSLSDRWGQHQVLRLTAIMSMIFGGLSLIPITNSFRLWLFALWRFGDGTANGLFWPTVQKYSVFADKYGIREKQRFLGGYNLSWNSGSLFSMILGTALVFLTGDNYQVFYLNFGGAVCGVIVAFFWLQALPEENIPLLDEKTKNDSNRTISNSEQELAANILRRSDPKLLLFPMKLNYMLLLIHSFTDGAISIILPMKVSLLGFGSYWVFLLGLIKSFIQTIISTTMSQIRPSLIFYTYFAVLITMPFLWISFIFVNQIGWVCVILFISGFCQGTIYALGVFITSIQAHSANSAMPYSLFQATMSGGRMAGPWLIGLGTLFSFYGGLWLIIGYDFLISATSIGYFAKKGLIIKPSE
jgi:MFS family permease